MTEPTKEIGKINETNSQGILADANNTVLDDKSNDFDESNEGTPESKGMQSVEIEDSPKNSRINRKFINEKQEGERRESRGMNKFNSNNNANKIGKVSTRSTVKTSDFQHTQLQSKTRRRGRPPKISKSNEISESMKNLDKFNSLPYQIMNGKAKELSNSKESSEISQILNNTNREATVTTPMEFSGEREESEEEESDLEVSFRVRPDDSFKVMDSSSESDMEIDTELNRNRRKRKSRSRTPRRDESYKCRHHYESRSGSRERKRESNSNEMHSSHNSRKRKEDKESDKYHKTMKKYKNDPILQQMVKQMVTEQMAEAQSKQQENGGMNYDNLMNSDITNKRGKINRDSGMVSNCPVNEISPNQINNSHSPFLNLSATGGKMKSPSDSTLYTPAVNRLVERQVNHSSQNSQQGIPRMIGNEAIMSLQNEAMVNDYLMNFRYDTGRRMSQPTASRGNAGPSMATESVPINRQHVTNNQMDMVARSSADEAILQAERFKASIQTNNPGRQNIDFMANQYSINQNHVKEPNVTVQNTNTDLCNKLRQLRYNDAEDDEFFHITCHIDTQTRQKIEKGEFIELEKLLVKNPTLEKPNEKRMQLVNRDGMTFFVLSNDKEKVDSIRKWEQAFRIYTTIYCNTNPHRAGEILQYTETIHRAASIFCWDNVARYDYVFRQLMAQKPHRSWAKIYNQMWNTTLNEPIRRFEQSNKNGNNNSAKRNWKDNCCWRFNKGTCKYGKSCKFDHKCSYCGSYSHPSTGCNKKKNGESNKKPNEGKK